MSSTSTSIQKKIELHELFLLEEEFHELGFTSPTAIKISFKFENFIPDNDDWKTKN